MKAIPLAELPKFDHSSAIDFCFLFNSNVGLACSYLVYECHRDFLSVPRSFAIIEFSCNSADAVDLNVIEEYACFSYSLDAGLCEQLGFFRIENSASINDPDDIHFFMSMSNRAIEVICQRYSFLKTLYHCRDAKSAFYEYIRDTA